MLASSVMKATVGKKEHHQHIQESRDHQDTSKARSEGLHAKNRSRMIAPQIITRKCDYKDVASLFYLAPETCWEGIVFTGEKLFTME